MHFLANTSGIIGPTLTGFLVQFTGSFTSAFLLAGLLTVIGAVCVARYVKPLSAADSGNSQAQSPRPVSALSQP
jgi:ACS family hexuronate transporter-like MFS transporter